MKFFSFAAGVSLVLASSNAFAGADFSLNLSDFIVGGTPVAANDGIASSTVALVIVGSESAGPEQPGSQGKSMEVSLCTGSILSDDMIITAAHCVFNKPSSVHIVFGNAINPVNLRNSVEAASYIAHPDYNPEKMTADQNDVAAVFFKGGVPSGFRPAELLPESSRLENGERVVLAGFGITDAETKQGSGILREATVSIANASLGKTEVVLDQTHGQGACHGDSGGPAFLKNGNTNYLWGVTSRGYPNRASDDCAHDVVYTKIDSQMAFLQEAIRQFRQ
jgi:secreted trypsin-like serine protease